MSPSKAYLATRFVEAGPFIAVCNEVVIVTPKEMAFSSKDVKRYVSYTVFETACSTRTEIQWTGANELLVTFEGYDKTQPETDHIRKSDVSGQVAIKYAPMPNLALQGTQASGVAVRRRP